MKKLTRNKSYVVLPLIEIVFSIFALIWMFVPQYDFSGNVTSPLSFNSYDFLPLYLYYLIYLIPAVVVYKVISIFLQKKIPFLFSSAAFIPIFVNVIISSVIILPFAYYVFKYAENLQFFLDIKPITYILTCFSIIANISFLLLLINNIVAQDASYKEYLQIQQAFSVEESKNKLKYFFSLQQKILFYFISIVLSIIIVLSTLILTDYKKTLLDSVKFTGKTLAEQSVHFFKENFTDDINLNFYTSKEKSRNEEAEFKYESLAFYMKKPGTDDFSVKVSTSTEGDSEKTLPQNKVREYTSVGSSGIYYENKIYAFVAPVIVSNSVIGFSVIKYHEDTIYKPFFRALIRAVFITLLVLYVSIIIVFFFGTRIVFPILYLQLNVKTIGSNLLKMVEGKIKKSASILSYDDKVNTRDEIKVLSLEVQEMVKVIKGIIPYVSTSTLQASDKLGNKSELKNLTFLFTDIRGFTTMCEGMAPDKVVSILNRYLELQTDIIQENNGDIDKFVGDEIMAVFDGENKEKDACRAAMRIRKQMQEEKELREKENKTTVAIGIGINTGEVVFGNVGAKERMDFTSIGDTVNLAARLEGVNKAYKTKTLITEYVYDEIKDEFLCREIDLLAVKGKSKPVRIYEVIQERNKCKKKLYEIVENFELGLAKYRQKRWDEALDYFDRNLQKFNDLTSEVFIDRISHFKADPPPDDWDGVFIMKVK